MNIQDVLTQPWTPFTLCAADFFCRLYRNSRYQVYARRVEAHAGWPVMTHLSYKRLDHGIFIPYRDKMRIKDELVGRDCEGVELLPARSREVDLANEYHAWIFRDPTMRFPFGFPTRYVSDVCLYGTHQEPWPPDERPDN
jgi:hypothetical protein